MQMCCHLRNVRSLASHTLGSILSSPASLIHVVGSTTPSGSCAFCARLAAEYLDSENPGNTDESVPYPRCSVDDSPVSSPLARWLRTLTMAACDRDARLDSAAIRSARYDLPAGELLDGL